MRDLTPFINRLKKNDRHTSKLARRMATDCWRVYDRDLPEFPVAVDRYGDWLHIAEYDTGWQQDDETREIWAEGVKAACAEALSVPFEQIAFKTRQRQKGLAQYEKTGDAGEFFVVHEAGLRFEVNLTRYLDTGLFLDHRPTRARVRSEATGKRFLNLFAYTGSFTVHAAAGGASSSMTVDLSNTYLDWAERNLALNGLDLPCHRRERADVLAWLDDAIDQRQQYDLIVMDPPSFSNSKKMFDTLDVQRDQHYLVDSAMQLLAPGGVLYFSNNLRGFTLATELAERYHVTDITHQSVPEDFRNRKIHQCFHIIAKDNA